MFINFNRLVFLVFLLLRQLMETNQDKWKEICLHNNCHQDWSGTKISGRCVNMVHGTELNESIEEMSTQQNLRYHYLFGLICIIIQV